MVDGMKAATLFNVMLYDSDRNRHFVKMFSLKLIAATDANRDELNKWFVPINNDPKSTGHTRKEKNYTPRTEYDSFIGTDTKWWLTPVQAAMEQRADAIFVLCGGFGNYNVPFSDDESSGAPDTEKMAAYREKLAAVREKARKMFGAENAARAKRGLPPKIVYDWNRYMRDELHLSMPTYPSGRSSSPSRGPLGVVLDHLDAVCEFQYAAEKLQLPRLNFVYLVAKDSSLQREYDDTVMFNHIADEFRGSFKILRGSRTMKNLTY